LCVKIDVNCILTERKVMSQHPQARSIIIGAAALALTVASALVFPNALAQRPDGHVVLVPEEIRWSPGPPSIPAGAQAVVMYGDPGKDGLFALRLKLPKGYAFAPHTRPKPEIVTVISGTFRLGMGEGADPTKALAAGSFFALQPGMVHFAFADEDTVIQLDSMGPWSLTYVNPKDDPRNKGQRTLRQLEDGRARN
jgi:quercetin dioxygenase-like cupin family protein